MPPAPADATARYHLICGDDEYLVEHAARLRYAHNTRDATDEYSREIINATAAKAEDIERTLATLATALRTQSLFGDKRHVWLRGMNWLADSAPAKTEAAKKALEKLQQLLAHHDPAHATLVISAHPIDRRRRETKWLEANGETTLINAARDPRTLDALIAGETRATKTQLGETARQTLIAKVSGNTRLILEELRKLACYLGPDGGEITQEHILRLVPNFGEGDFFEPVEAFYNADLTWALDALNRYFYHAPESGRPLLASLQNRNRLLIQLRTLIDSGELHLGRNGISKSDLERAAATHGAHFGNDTEKNPLNAFTQNHWYLGNKIAPAARHFTLRSLIDLQLDLIDAFAAILHRPDEQEAIFRELFIHTLGKGK
ncbi:MAG: DNA polymerase III subunit delta [Puniceicoccales bacterium]|jgi:DNA polymerase-3 subunit delta|nr:DNA polymerase III subunit delta [Puniceicoccales bacterium]